MTNTPIKCDYCGKIFFPTDTEICPFCKKDRNPIPDFFKEIFKNNLFTDSDQDDD
jgi:hypothetical protein